ncbi:MAG TPA: poly-gamma-glutamate biosynthesis protein, partial [Lachnospiraceae bacterium]|nr:poly-gamma-glutamate biosynthesis protein [Lachnospiraceae bacterium]
GTGAGVTKGAGVKSRAGTDMADDADAGAERPEVTLVMVGDILLHTPVAESGRREDGSYDFSAVFAQMREEISSADVALVNQEVILGGEELGVSGYPAFNAPYELGDALVDAGFDVVLHATNHALDKGRQGLVNCLAFWQESYPDIAVLGIHGSEADQEEIYVYEQDGIRIAVLNYTYGTNGIALPQDMPWAVDLLDRQRVAEDLQRARGMSDFIIVCPHWGTEYVLEETAEQEEWAEFFAENGADLILGTHPHVIEPVEWAGADSGDGRGTLSYYSLGNFVNWTSGTGEGVANRMVGGMAKVTIGLDEAGEAVITSYGVEPLVCHVEQGYGGVTVYPLEEYTEELAGRNEIVNQDGQFSLSYCRKLAGEVFGSLWLP